MEPRGCESETADLSSHLTESLLDCDAPSLLPSDLLSRRCNLPDGLTRLRGEREREMGEGGGERERGGGGGERETMFVCVCCVCERERERERLTVKRSNVFDLIQQPFRQGGIQNILHS